MTAYDRLPDGVADVFGTDATADSSYGLLTVDVPPASWIAALETARDQLGCTYFDWLSAVDEPGTGFRICAHVVALGGPPPAGAIDGDSSGAEVRAEHASPGGVQVRRLMLRTTVPHDAPVLPTAREVYAGADWHERETHEMFGVEFTDHPHLVPLLLPEGFEGHPLRKDFVLAARVAKAWPGAKEPGESEHGGPKRRQMLPPGVPDPNEWGPLKGQLPPAPARPARTPRAAGAAAGERPARRARTVGEGSASQAAGAEGTAAPAAPARRSRSVSEGSASQAAQRPAAAPGTGSTGTAPAANGDAGSTGSTEPTPPEPAASAGPPASKSPSADQGPARQRGESATPSGTGDQQTAAGSAPQTGSPAAARGADAPWHHARPAFDSPRGAEAADKTDSADKTDRVDSADGADGAGKADSAESADGTDSTDSADSAEQADSATEQVDGGATEQQADPAEKPDQDHEPRPQQHGDPKEPGGDPA
ncbi:NADH-quinone oxidoreductase subunit C [Streptomyces sp. NPDC005963]|uniref:NADH-quinone oxidoreductase subunit C n=1 Tax=Streptomyces sp. NPDC005963 TaxID=3156721 RepID=UPI0033CDDCAA